MYQSPYANFMSQASLIRVTGVEGARAYQMGANSVVALFDNNEDIMYIKSTDGAGFPTIRTFQFTEVFEPKLTNDFITRAEFEKLKEEIENGKHIISEESTAAEPAATGEKHHAK